MILVVGGMGFVGSNFIDQLNRHSRQDIIIVDRINDDARWKNLSGLIYDDLISPELIEEHLSSSRNFFSYLDKRIGDIQLIVHLADIRNNRDLVLNAHYLLPMYLWRWCTQHNKRFIFATTAETYCNGENSSSNTLGYSDYLELRTEDFYTWTKLQFEFWALSQLRSGRPGPKQWVGLRLFDLYGPREEHRPNASIISACFDAALRDELPASDSTASLYKRDLMHVQDSAKVLEWLSRNENTSKSGLFTIGSGHSYAIGDVVNVMSQTLGIKTHTGSDFTPAIHERYKSETYSDISKLRNTGYKTPFMNLEEGVREYANYLALKQGERNHARQL